MASTLANVHRDPKKRPQGYRPADFMPYRPPEPKLDQAALERRLLASFGLTLDKNKARGRGNGKRAGHPRAR